MDLDRVIQTDCIEWMQQADPVADLVFADPPFNIGYKYDVYEDQMAYQEYFDWTESWMRAAVEVLKPTGSLWVAIGDEYAAEVRMIGRKLGLTLRNWVIWHYTFGQNTKAKFARAHAHLFYFVKDPTEFTYNDMAVRTFSDRQRIYRDRRANPDGRIPDDVWSEYPRVCGTFGEREGWHPCQMPMSLLARIIRACSNPDDVVLDPFAGSGTTLVAAKRLGRRYLGLELSENYVSKIRERLTQTPIVRLDQPGLDNPWPATHEEELQQLYMAASVSISMLSSNEMLLEGMARQLGHRLEAAGDDRTYSPQQVLEKLSEMARKNQLGIIKVHAKPKVAGRSRKNPQTAG